MQDRQLIDQAAEPVGAKRLQFMLASAIKEAKTSLLGQITLYAVVKTFKEITDFLDRTSTPSGTAGIKRLLKA